MKCGFVRIVLCLAVLPLCAGWTVAEATRFAGYYELSNVVENGSQVSVTMTLTLLNPGKTDVKGGIVAVLSSEPNPALIGSFAAIKTLPHIGQVKVSQTLTISAAEYASWRHGHAPRLQFLVPSGESAVAVSIQAYQVEPPSEKTD
jgi:hypothetical protein